MSDLIKKITEEAHEILDTQQLPDRYNATYQPLSAYDGGNNFGSGNLFHKLFNEIRTQYIAYAGVVAQAYKEETGKDVSSILNSEQQDFDGFFLIGYALGFNRYSDDENARVDFGTIVGLAEDSLKNAVEYAVSKGVEYPSFVKINGDDVDLDFTNVDYSHLNLLGRAEIVPYSQISHEGASSLFFDILSGINRYHVRIPENYLKPVNERTSTIDRDRFNRDLIESYIPVMALSHIEKEIGFNLSEVAEAFDNFIRNCRSLYHTIGISIDRKPENSRENIHEALQHLTIAYNELETLLGKNFDALLDSLPDAEPYQELRGSIAIWKSSIEQEITNVADLAVGIIPNPNQAKISDELDFRSKSTFLDGYFSDIASAIYSYALTAKFTLHNGNLVSPPFSINIQEAIASNMLIRSEAQDAVLEIIEDLSKKGSFTLQELSSALLVKDVLSGFHFDKLVLEPNFYSKPFSESITDKLIYATKIQGLQSALFDQLSSYPLNTIPDLSDGVFRGYDKYDSNLGSRDGSFLYSIMQRDLRNGTQESLTFIDILKQFFAASDEHNPEIQTPEMLRLRELLESRKGDLMEIYGSPKQPNVLLAV